MGAAVPVTGVAPVVAVRIVKRNLNIYQCERRAGANPARFFAWVRWKSKKVSI